MRDGGGEQSTPGHISSLVGAIGLIFCAVLYFVEIDFSINILLLIPSLIMHEVPTK